jgi:serine/threonine protein kinase
MRLQGHEIDEIAADVQRSLRTVRRTLAGLAEELERRLRPAPPVEQTNSLSYSDILLQQQLGEGGMGKVYRALRRTTNTHVAVKILRKPLRQHTTAVARFLHEAELLARLRHPGIVAVHGLGQLPDGGHFLMMDLIEGSDLARQMAAGSVPVRLALGWVSEAADAIEHAHQQGIVHCDLKPSNLLLGQDRRLCVTDFGLARSLADSGGLPAGGTVGYMAPEQVDPSLGPITPATDIYGLGAVLYALLEGRPPLGPDSLSRSNLPADVADLCRRCLAAKPEERFASAAELAEALRGLERTIRA